MLTISEWKNEINFFCFFFTNTVKPFFLIVQNKCCTENFPLLQEKNYFVILHPKKQCFRIKKKSVLKLHIYF